MADKLFYSMGEVAEMFDVNTSLIRHWESQFSILRPKRNKKGNRLFSPEDVENLKMIYHLVKERGMTLEGAKKALRKAPSESGVDRDAELMERLQRIRALLVEVREDLKAGEGEIVTASDADMTDADAAADAAAADAAAADASAETPVRRRRAHSAQAERIIGVSPEIEHVRQLIDKVAPCEARVLITGENGTGQELVARWLHAKSVRAAAPFVEVNCAAIPSELIESELFGHERGAFTSAVKQRKGKFEQADGGTLFMDEIGDMSLAAQAKVLRALQESRISRVGSDRDIEVNVRVVAATNKNLREEIQKGNFREDLYHRLAVIVVRVPPLREHAGDIPALVEHFIRTIASEYGSAPKPIDADALAELQRMPWSGNIRELRNVIERLIILSGDRITARDVKEYC